MADIILCGKIRAEPFPHNPYSKVRTAKYPTCNRVKGHENLGGEATRHRQVNRLTFEIEAEWGEFQCTDRIINGGLPLRKGGS